jgi:putative flippase GtrA
MRFLLVSLAALGANLLVLDVLVNSAGVNKLVAQAIAVVVVTPLNFVGNKLWSFRRATP